MFIMRGHEHRAAEPKSFLGKFQRGFERWFERFRGSYRQLLETTLEHRTLFSLGFAAFCFLSLGLVFFLGQDFFPQVDAGLIRLHFRARPGLRVEETARLCDEVERVLRSEIPKRRTADDAGQHRRPLLGHQSFLLQFGSDWDERCGDSDFAESGTPSSDGAVCAQVAPRTAIALSGRGVLLPARRHRVANSQFWIARAGRYSGHGRRYARELRHRAEESQIGCARFPAPPTYMCNR